MAWVREVLSLDLAGGVTSEQAALSQPVLCAQCPSLEGDRHGLAKAAPAVSYWLGLASQGADWLPG